MSRNSYVMEGYEKIKSVGKGSFGTATLYRRVTDDLLVVMKDVFLTDMSQTERRLAMNEVQVLAALNHENIIRYLGSFEKDGSLLIIMEYADGGNLQQLISVRRDKMEVFPEPMILDVFSQICNGMSYMHANKILHRDMKAANIFLNKDGTVKIGDFGISKMMDTRSQAQTVVGTPYYLSPEMCEGKDYNEKSDIWAMGCILYELTCLKKPFEAASLPVLVQKITACEVPPIPENYTNGLSHLIHVILQKDLERRPAAQYMYDTIIPAIFESLDANLTHRRFSLASIFRGSIPLERSVLYEMYGFTTNANLYPVQLPHMKILDFCNSETHFLLVTDDTNVYSWGEDNQGQLAQGNTDTFRKFPMCIDYLRGKNIVRCFAGNGYSIFLNDNGIMYSCGDGKYGCLGHGDWNNIIRPKIIDIESIHQEFKVIGCPTEAYSRSGAQEKKLIKNSYSEDCVMCSLQKSLVNTSISEISCGSRHVVALATNGKVFSWGSAHEGQLGLGHTQYCCKPISIRLTNEYNIRKVYAGMNSSALLTTSGKVLVSGNNSYNKLGFENITYIKTFLILGGLNERVKEVALGQTHTVLLTEGGDVFCLGNGEDGQCGSGTSGFKMFNKIDELSKVIKISTGPSYTIASTEDNVIYFWGTHYTSTNHANSSGSSGDNSQVHLLHSDHIVQIESRFTHMKYVVSAEPRAYMPVLELMPKPILALYSSPKNLKSGNSVWLAGLSANDNSVSVLVHTTAPPPIKKITDDDGDELDPHSQELEPHWTSFQRASTNGLSIPNTPQAT